MYSQQKFRNARFFSPILPRGAFVTLIAFLAIMAANLFAYAATTEEADPGWPRLFEKDGRQVTVYQPQIEEWSDYKAIHALCAIAFKPDAAKEESFGVVDLTAKTIVDHDARVVMVMPTKREVRFPNLPDEEAAKLSALVNEVWPPKDAVSVSLDRVLAYMEPEKQANRQAVEVNLDPPTIYYSAQPAILVIFMGAPQFKPITPEKTDLMFAVNTNWDMFLDTAAQRYYLLDNESWLTAPDAIKGPWTAAETLPAALASLPDDDNWSDVRKNIPGKFAQHAPLVFATTDAAELIVTEGEPSYSPIAGTKLMRVANTDSTLFLHLDEKLYYLLVAGRWFSAKTLDGAWTAASATLPADFANIPDDDPSAFVKASVPGTREAQDTLLLASIPTTTTVNLTQVEEQVSYDGDPKFVAIEGTTVKYAVNSPYSIFLAEGKYYWCSEGAWLVSDSPNGPWSFATMVPAAIYSIPPTHPTYNVTYVVVENSTPTTATYSYTSGYSGEYVAATGVLMFGMGMLFNAAMDYDDDYYYYRGPVFSYGCGAVYDYNYGGYYRSAGAYGPYGGTGRAAAYNPRTGTYARGAYAYGPNASGSFRQAYNPYTDTYARSTRVDTRYGEAGRGYVERDGKSAWGGYRSGEYGTAAGVRTSEGAGVAGWDTARGQGAVAKDREGNVYAGKDGNVYKRENNGSWSNNDGKTWQNADRSQQRQNLESQAQSRQRGSQQSRNAANARSSRSSGGRSGGGGRRR
ncbi:hypothetical protein U14_00217 [Candidatus Moduliflexus flocculans]|uniref:Carbohydrate-binding family V/XII n=1 Tax=Candidatus Moduliflexus flocculans TaxID=1499966 RepID=A0A0S6VPG7_9BACT|nr:hypothetical protein U14_00217 [Candidatus Moduliflexus flocculans]